MNISLQPTAILASSSDSEGCLVLADGALAAILVRLTDEDHGSLCGSWYLEMGFGPCATASSACISFPTLERAMDWAREQLSHPGSRNALAIGA